MIERMGVRKFTKRTCRNPSMNDLLTNAKREIDVLVKHGYIVIDNITSDRDNDWVWHGNKENYVIEPHMYMTIELWCNQNFKPKNWTYLHDHWVFTKEDDATLFKLAWL